MGVTGAPGGPGSLPFAAWGGLTPTMYSFVPGQRGSAPPQQLARAFGLHKAGVGEWPRGCDRGFCCLQPQTRPRMAVWAPLGMGPGRGSPRARSHSRATEQPACHRVPRFSAKSWSVGEGKEAGAGQDPSVELTCYPDSSSGLSIAQVVRPSHSWVSLASRRVEG